MTPESNLGPEDQEFLSNLEDLFTDAEKAKKEAEEEKQRIIDATRAEVEGRTADEIATDALLEARFAQASIIAMVGGMTELHGAMVDRFDEMHSHLHKSDQGVSNQVIETMFHFIALLTGEAELSEADLDTFKDSVEQMSHEDQTSPRAIAEAFVDYLRERREGASRFTPTA